MNNLEELLKNNLDGKVAYVKSSGLTLEGSLEDKCTLKYIPYHGIQCITKLEYNQCNVVKLIEQSLVNMREDVGMTYDVRDKILDVLIPTISNTYVQIGMINMYGIKSINTQFNNDGTMTEARLIYDSGNIISITSIQTKV